METTNRTVLLDLAETIMLGAHTYYTPVLVSLGTLGNCLAVCVLFRTQLRRSSSSLYLAALAISDTGFLLSLIIPWLDLVGLTVFNRPGYCQFFVYLPTSCSFMSSWFVVAFTVERFVAVRYPLRRQSMCTVARAKIIIFGLVVVGLVICTPVLWFSSPIVMNRISDVPVCTLAEEWENWASLFNVADTVLTFVIPFSIIFLLNGMIINTVWSLARIRRTMTSDSRNDGDETNVGSRSSVSQIKVTKMLLVVSSVFLCFNLPAYVMRVHAFLQADESPLRETVLTQYVCNLLFDTNFGINFVLYCASGQNFRKAVVRMMQCRSRRCNYGEHRHSIRGNQSGLETGRYSSSMTRQRTIVIDMPWKGSCELRDLSRNNDEQSSKYDSRQSSKE